jgi:serine/threonine-protein phosphatase 2A regulatory subunit B''
MEKIKKLSPNIKSNIRYKLCSKIMQENFIYWLSLPSTLKLIQNLFDICKTSNISISSPNPFFINNIKNSLTSSQIPSPSSFERKNSSKKKFSDSLTNSMISSMKLSTIPKFYFPTVGKDIINQENLFIDLVFKNIKKVDLKSFTKITEEFYNFPSLLNQVLFDKIDKENKGFITKEKFMEFHIKNFRGCSRTELFFNLIKSPERKYIIKEDFKPILQVLLDKHPSLEFLKEKKENLPYQTKYMNTVIIRIFYVNDSNDDGKITLHDFKRSDLIDVITQVCDDDVNNVRQYFSYEHFYVIYSIFSELNNSDDPANELFINKQNFSKYDEHSLNKKAVDRIFEQIPRKFVSKEKNKMCYEDFLWYILSEEDKTNPTSIKYWFKVIDLDDNGIITPSEMEYFYQVQIELLESYQNEIIEFNDVLCQLNDMIPPEKEYQWTLQNFLLNPEKTSNFFNALLNINKYIINERKEPFSLDDIDKKKDYSDWDKFAAREYYHMTHPEFEEDEVEQDDYAYD